MGHRGTSTLLLGLLLVAGIPFAGRVAMAGDEKSVDTRLRESIDSLRGKNFKNLSGDEREAFGDRLDEAWDFLLEHRSAATPLVREALAAETDDGFRIIDLASLLLRLDGELAVEAASALLRADPNDYPQGYFNVASRMGAMHCAKCLPAVLRMLEVGKVEAYISAHALPVGQELGLTFTLGHYGDRAIPGILDGLGSPRCEVRSNAALAAAILLPPTEPPALRKIARDDECATARHSAWIALGVLDSPALAGLATRRLAASPGPPVDERLTIVAGLSLALAPSVLKPLGTLAGDSDSDVAEAARTAREEFEGTRAGSAGWRSKVGSAPPARQSKIRMALGKAREEGRFEFEGKPEDLIAALTLEDRSLVSEARAAVLNRLSDECLSEYGELTFALRVLRSVGSGPKAPDRSASQDSERR